MFIITAIKNKGEVMGTKIYMQFGNIKSTTTDSNHKDWVEISSLRYGGSRDVTQTSGSSSRNISTPHISSFSLTKKMNLGTQALFKEAFGGQGIDICTIHLVGDKGVYMEYKLHKAVISNYTVDIHDDMPEPKESFAVHFTRLDTRYIPTDSLNGPVNAGYDMEQAKLL